MESYHSLPRPAKEPGPYENYFYELPIPRKEKVMEEEVKEDVTNDDDDEEETEEPRSPDDTKTTSHHSPIAAFLPPQQALWTWADPGWRQSSKSRRLNHSVITKRPREGEEAPEVRVGDCAVFLSTSRPDRPYIGRIHSLWQTAGGNMKVTCHRQLRY